MTYFVKVYRLSPIKKSLNMTECDNLDEARMTAVNYFRKGYYYRICAVPWLGNHEHGKHGVEISKTKDGAIVGFVTLINYVWYWVPNKANAEIKRINPDNGKIMR